MLLHPTSSGAEIKRHVALVRCKVMFTCPALLSTCNEVLDSGELAIYLLDLPSVIGQSLDPMRNKTLDELIKEGWDQRNKIEPTEKRVRNCTLVSGQLTALQSRAWLLK